MAGAASSNNTQPIVKVKHVILNQRGIQVCLSKIKQVMEDQELSMTIKAVPLAQLNPDYYYL